MIPEGYGQASFRFTGAAAPQGALCTLGFVVVEGNTPDDLAAEMFDNWGDNVLNEQTNDINLVEVLVKFGPDEDGPSGSFSGSRTGATVATSAPPNCAVLVKKQTVMGGRKNRGRMYIPGVDETQLSDGGLIDSAKVGTWQSHIDTFRTRFTAEGNDMVVLHGDATTPTLITALTVDSIIATQRNRLR